MEHVRQGAPAAVPGEQRLLGGSRLAILAFDLLEGPDRREVVARFFLQPALADPVRRRYPEVPRRRRGRLRFRLDFPDGGLSAGGFSSSPGRNAHSLVASSHAAW